MSKHSASPFDPAALVANTHAFLSLGTPLPSASPSGRHIAGPRMETAIAEHWLRSAYPSPTPQDDDWEDFTISEPPC